MKNFSLKSLFDAYNEMCVKVNGELYSKQLCEHVCGHNFTDECFDVNYKDFCFTVECDVDNGYCNVLDDGIEYYNTDGQFVCNVNLVKLKHYIEDGFKFIVFCIDDIDGSFPNDKVKFAHFFDGIDFQLSCICDDRGGLVLNNDNIRIIRLSDFEVISLSRFRELQSEIDEIKNSIFY